MQYLSVFGLAVAGIFLAGCSLLPERIVPTGSSVPVAFQTKATVGSIWRSEDGGKTFEPRITVDEKTKITSADVLDISFVERVPAGAERPAQAPEAYVGTVETGIFKTENGGERWQHVTFPPKKIYSFIVDRADPAHLFATGVIGNVGKMFRSTDHGKTWQDPYSEPGPGSLVLSLAQHARDTHVILAGTSNGTVVKSTDRGETWKNVGQKIDGPVTTITYDAAQPRTVYALVFQKKLWHSLNGGEEWIDWEEVKQKEQQECQKRQQERQRQGEVKGGTDACAKIVDPKRVMPQGIMSVVADPAVSGRLLAGTGSGLFESTDYGKYWDELNVIESAKQFPLRAIAINPKNPQEIVFASGKVFYKSINGGDTWSVVTLNVDRAVSAIQYDPFNPSIIYVGLRKM